MSAMKRLSTDMESARAGVLSPGEKAAYLAAMAKLGYEPDDTVTELDVIEPEYAAARAWVRCEECDDMGEAIDMCYQHDGSWLCVRCDRRHKADWDDYMSAARGW